MLMFTGIVEALGTVAGIERRDGDIELRIDLGTLPRADMQLGDSISVSGACLTVTRSEGPVAAFDVSNETLAKTTLGELVPGSSVNLERALRAGGALGGHYVTGHIDGLARLVSRTLDARSLRLVFEVEPALARFVAPKGSVTLAGVSLTVNEVDGSRFGINLIPHTQQVTTLGSVVEGALVNFEIDIIARYVDRLMDGWRPRPG
jgi:riboflavin synthase